ncbi:hypothetical protein [Actinocorallia herbida]|nr:hypothetical protein [Actinocorallia herbida]
MSTNGIRGAAPVTPQPPLVPASESAFHHLTALSYTSPGIRAGDDMTTRGVRSRLGAILAGAFADRGLPFDLGNRAFLRDRGDVLLLMLPMTVPTHVVYDVFATGVHAGVRTFNRRGGASFASENATLEVRVAQHFGRVHFDGLGVFGRSLDVLRTLLAACAPGEYMHLLSDPYYRDLRSATLVDPDDHEEITAIGTDMAPHRGWLRVPDPHPAVGAGRTALHSA